jgi:hypothetical protein
LLISSDLRDILKEEVKIHQMVQSLPLDNDCFLVSAFLVTIETPSSLSGSETGFILETAKKQLP